MCIHVCTLYTIRTFMMPTQSSTTHFVAHILRPNKKWYTFDNTNSDIIPSNFKQKKIHSILLCYTCVAIYGNDLSLKNDSVLKNLNTHESDSKESKDACISNSSEPDNDLSLKNNFVTDFILKNFHTYESDSEDSKDIYILPIHVARIVCFKV